MATGEDKDYGDGNRPRHLPQLRCPHGKRLHIHCAVCEADEQECRYANWLDANRPTRVEILRDALIRLEQGIPDFDQHVSALRCFIRAGGRIEIDNEPFDFVGDVAESSTPEYEVASFVMHVAGGVALTVLEAA